MKRMAVVGKDVSKSLSPKMHTFLMKKFGVEATYEAISVPPEDFAARIPAILNSYDFLNVTIPYKLDIMPYLAEILDDAETFGAVNVVDARARRGYNTDGMGFVLMLRTAGVSLAGKSVLVLGSGGVGRSVIKKLVEFGCRVSAYDRELSRTQAVFEEFGGFTPLTEVRTQPYDIIVNCTGVGMHKTEGISPVGKELLSLCTVACDLIYVPKKSRFLEIAEECGKQIIDGEPMLFYQAYYGDCILLGREPKDEEAKLFYEEYLKL